MQQDASSSRTQLGDLPVALLAQIVQHVPLPQRLGSAALVGRDWAKAAAQSVRQLQLKLSDTTARGLEAWLQQHGGQLESLELQQDDRDYVWLPVQLPWDRLSGLQRLNLQDMDLPAVASTAASAAQAGSSSAVVAPLLPHLQHLELSSCYLDSTDCLLQLASPTLTRLVAWWWVSVSTEQQDSVNAAMSSLLQRLPNLRELHLLLDPNTELTLSSDVVPHMAAMQQLQDLELCLGEGDFGDCFASLPSSLTRLQLADDRNKAALDASAAEITSHPTLPPQLLQLSGLQDLTLVCCMFEPTALGSMPALQQLDLQECILLPCGPEGERLAGSIAAFLSTVASMTRLQALSICDMSLCTSDPALQQFTALTASSQLTQLYMVAQEALPVPDGALQHMFPAGRQLPQLRRLSIAACSDGEYDTSCITRQDLAHVITCCPGLEHLEITHTLEWDEQPPVQLLQLPQSCSSLWVGGDALSDADAHILAQLTQLTSLYWQDSPLMDVGAEMLTALQGLKELVVRRCGLTRCFYKQGDDSSDDDEGGSAGRGDEVPTLKLVGSEDKGPVWQQLRALCDNSCMCYFHGVYVRNAS